jgi:hypothetical protein
MQLRQPEPSPPQAFEQLQDRSVGWRLEFYRANPGASSTPLVFSDSNLLAVGEGVHHVDFDSSSPSWSNLPRAAGLKFLGGSRQLPEANFAWRYTGRVRINIGGQYTFCTESDDGSLLYMDLSPVQPGGPPISYTLIVDNDGLHSRQQKCATVQLGPGDHHTKVFIRPPPTPACCFPSPPMGCPPPPTTTLRLLPISPVAKFLLARHPTPSRDSRNSETASGLDDPGADARALSRQRPPPPLIPIGSPPV